MRIRVFVLTVSVLILSLLLAACAPAGTPPAAGTGTASAGAAAAAPSVSAESQDLTYLGVPVGFTPEGAPYRGDPSAPLTLQIFTDFQCPFCARHFVQTEPAIEEAYVRKGLVQLVFNDLPLAELHPNAMAAHEAAACIAEQGAPRFWAMYDAIFMAQDEWAESSDPGPIFERLAQEIGADVDAFRTCVAGTSKEMQVQASVDAALALGFNGTPSFRVNDHASGQDYDIVGAQPFDRFAGVFDALIAGKEPPVATQPKPEPAAIPFWATPEGLALDPNRPGYTVAGDQSRGSPDAKVVVVEFSDFQCPYCRQHETETRPTLDKQFVDSGQVRWVYKHFPLSIHPQAQAAGIAAECAADKGKFWEMHDKLFATVEQWSVDDPSPVLSDIASGLGLDRAEFERCLADPARLQLLESDMADGAAYVQGTPTFIILTGSGGRIIPGALPLQSFSAEIQKALDAQS